MRDDAYAMEWNVVKGGGRGRGRFGIELSRVESSRGREYVRLAKFKGSGGLIPEQVDGLEEAETAIPENA